MEQRESYSVSVKVLDMGAASDTIDASGIRSSTVTLPQFWREYLMKRRQALLMEVSEIERILNLSPSRLRRVNE